MRSPLPPTYIQDMYDSVAQRGGYPTVRATYGAGIAAAVPPRHPTGANVTVTYYNRTGGERNTSEKCKEHYALS